MGTAWHHQQPHRPDWYGHQPADSITYIARVSEPLTPRPKTYRAALQVKAIRSAKGIQPVSGQLWAYLAKDSAAAGLQYGDWIVFNTAPQPIRNSGNPGTFDYARYAALQNMFTSVYLPRGAWKALSRQDPYPLPAFVYRISGACLQILQQSIPDSTSAGVAKALLIGYRDELDQELVQQYTNAGIIHIIAISGLHMGVVYGLILWLLQWLPDHRFRLVKYPVAMLGMWLFTFMTGAPASVVRSAVMFTCVALGKMGDKKGYSLNFLAASACLLLWYNPWWLFDIGFQLSYLAILSIFIFYQPLYRRVYFPKKWFSQIWQLVSCTLAAQVLTLPLTLYYFHQFPLGFVLSNLVAIPLSTLLLYAELALVACYPFSATAAGWVGWLVHWGITAMNQFVGLIDALKLHLTGIQISMVQYLSLFVLIAALYGWIKQKRFIPALITCFCFTIYAAEELRLSYQALRQGRLVLYNIPGVSASAVEKGRTAFVRTGPLTDSAKQFKFNIEPGHIASRKKQVQVTHQLPRFETAGHASIVYIDSAGLLPSVPMKVNYVVLRYNPSCSIEKIISQLQPDMLVFDSSNRDYNIKKWKKACERLTLRHFSVPDEGVLVLNF